MLANANVASAIQVAVVDVGGRWLQLTLAFLSRREALALQWSIYACEVCYVI